MLGFILLACLTAFSVTSPVSAQQNDASGP